MRKSRIPVGTVVRTKVGLSVPAGSPAYVVKHENAVHLLTHGGGGLVVREEVEVPRTPLPAFTPMRLYIPYGQWTEPDGAIVLFSRDYMPLWRLRAGKPADPIAPWTWIEFEGQEWFWQEMETPWRNRRLTGAMERRMQGWGITQLPPLVQALPLLTSGQIEDIPEAVRAMSPRGCRFRPISSDRKGCERAGA